ncbi:ABC transporter ATP-binding protein [Paenibacillus tundrae]
MSSLTFQNVSYQYDAEPIDIIDNLSFTIEAGSFHSIVGASGCGKSTIFHLINGLLRPKSGSIRIDGAPIGDKKHYCGYMPQKDLLFAWRTVGENLGLPLEIIGGYTKAECKELIADALHNVGLDHCHNKMPHELSGGMRQRAAFARTMLTGSDLLLLDEPFSALDFLTGITMQEWLLEQWEQHKKTIIFITHNVDEALFLSQRILAVTRTPINQLTTIDIPNGYHHSRESLASPEISALRNDLIQSLRTNVIL